MTSYGTIEYDGTTPPTNGQVPVYDSTAHKYKPGTVSGGGGSTPTAPSAPTQATDGSDLILQWDGKDVSGDAMPAGFSHVLALALMGNPAATGGIGTSEQDVASFTALPAGWTDDIGTSAYADGQVNWTSGAESISFDLSALSAGVMSLETGIIAKDFAHPEAIFQSAANSQWTWFFCLSGTDAGLNFAFVSYGGGTLAIFLMIDNVLSANYLQATGIDLPSTNASDVGAMVTEDGMVVLLQRETSNGHIHIVTTWQIPDFADSAFDGVTRVGIGVWGAGVITVASQYSAMEALVGGDPIAAAEVALGTLAGPGALPVKVGDGNFITGAGLYLRGYNSAGTAGPNSASIAAESLPARFEFHDAVEVLLGANTGAMNSGMIGTWTPDQSTAQAGVWGWKATSSAGNEFTSFPFYLDPGRTYDVYMSYYMGPDAGQFAFSVTGQQTPEVDFDPDGPVEADGVIDAYASGAAIVLQHIGTVTFTGVEGVDEPLRETLQLETVGRNGASTGYVMGVYAAMLVAQ